MFNNNPITFLKNLDICAEYNEFVTGHDKTEYKKFVSGSKLHEKLFVDLKDPEKAERIWQNYQRFVFPFIQNIPAAIEKIEKWLSDHLLVLTCRQEDHLKELRAIEELSPFHVELSKFFSSIACQEHSHTNTNSQLQRPRRIVVITTSGAGGELMVATAIEQYLKKHCEIFCIDTEKVFKTEKDVLFRFSGMYSTDIYGEIFQKANDSELADDLWWKCDQLRRFIPDYACQLLKNEVRRVHPDLILSTRYYTYDDIAIAYDLNTPLRLMHCDYHFCKELLPVAQIVHTQLVKFWVPTSECIPMHLKDRVEVLGYPIRGAIQKLANPNEIQLLRTNLKIQENAVVILMMTGRQGMGKILLPLVRKINESGGSLGPLHVVIVCGNNSEMKEEISSYLKITPRIKSIFFDVKGFIDEETLADYYNITQLYIGKNGGATTAELIFKKIFGLICKSYELEVPNFNYFSALGLGFELNSDLIINQLKELLSKNKNSIQVPMIDWQERIMTLTKL